MARRMENVFIGELKIDSTWKQSKATTVSDMQTEPEEKEEKEVQTLLSALQVTEQQDKECGTDDASQRIPTAHSDGTQWIYPGEHFSTGKLANFLSDVEVDLVAELNANIKSNAFDHYQPNWTEKIDQVNLQQTLYPPFSREGEWHACSLSWNATGHSLAIAYGRLDTTTWCESKGYVCVWHLGRPDFAPDKPHLTLEADSYVHSVTFHPVLPSMVAAGTYNGEILLWDISEESPKAISSIMCTSAPREPVTKLQWLLNVRETREAHRYVLCSGSQDGKILFWSPANKFSDSLASYDVQNRKRNVVGVLSMGFVTAGGGGGMNAKTVAGVENLMLFGTETGEVFRTKPGAAVTNSSGGNDKAGGGNKRNTVLEIDHFDVHQGPVHTVDCSPFFRNLFMTCSSDGSIRLYSTLERHPLASLEPSMETKHFVYSAQWSPSRPSVLAAASRNSSVYIYDLEKSKTKPFVTVDGGVDGAAVCSLQFNKADHNLLATGDMRGNVKLWRLSSELTTATDLERAAVRGGEQPAAKVQDKTQLATENTLMGAEEESGANAQENPVRQLFGFQF